MNTLEFLQRVLPSSGYYVSTVVNPDRTRQKFYNTVEELADSVIELDKAGNNTYYAISAFIDNKSRRQDNVRVTKVIAIDVDCGESKPFPSWKEGLIALQGFVNKMQLPKPMVVGSGNGLHVYWVLTDELEPYYWKPIADAMKQATVACDFPVDPAPTANNALVLRPIGTHNPKNGKEVMLLIDAAPVSPDDLRKCLKVTEYVKERDSGLSAAITGGMDAIYAPANPQAIHSKCEQIKHIVNNSAEIDEPLWWLAMGVAAYCEDAEQTAQEWSKGHPTYDPDETVQKMERWKASATGPASCRKFNELNPKACKDCKFKGKVEYPTSLGRQYQVAAPSTDAPSPLATQVPLPRPYKRTVDGIKVVIDEVDIDICKFDIYPVGYGYDHALGYETVRYHWDRPHKGWQELSFRQAYLTDGSREFPTAIADQGIVLANKRQTEYFQLMLRSYMDELRQIRSMTNLYNSMGWKEDFKQFLLGDVLLQHTDTGGVEEVPVAFSASTQRLGHELYGRKGSFDLWRKGTAIMDKAGLYGHMFALGVSLSAPLYALTGLNGITISLYGPTGCGKTLAQMWQQSVWGDPTKLHFASKFTQNALYSRMGLYSNLPMSIDETTLMTVKDIPDMLYTITQGKDKARLSRSAEERDVKTWALPVTISTNVSMTSKLTASGLETDAQMARLLELEMHQLALFSKDTTGGRDLYNHVTNNYGFAGLEFVKRLVGLGEERLREMVADALEQFPQKYDCKFSGSERFWEQATVLADLSLRLAKEWNIIEFDYTKGITFVLNQIGAIRQSVRENRITTEQLVAEYLNEFSDAAVSMVYTGAQKGVMDLGRVPRSDLRIRFDLYRKTPSDSYDRGTVMLHRTHFRNWLATHGVDYRSVMRDLEAAHAIVPNPTQKAYLGKGTPIKVGQTYVITLNLCNDMMRGILEAEEKHIDDLKLGELKAV